MVIEAESPGGLRQDRDGENAAPAQAMITEMLVRDQLRRILGSEGFKASPRMSAFLQYTVEAALQGRIDELKETCVGVAVFNRHATYDPKIDPVVRSEARRLRKKLDDYAETRGAMDQVKISLPKGGYVPLIEKAPSRSTARLMDVESFQLHPGSNEPSYVLVEPSTIEVPVGASGCREDSDGAGQLYGRRLRWMFAAVLVALPVCLALAFVVLTWRRGATTVAAATAFDARPLTSIAGLAFQPSLSPDGKQTVFVWSENGLDFHLYMMQQGGKPLQLTSGAADDLAPSWSPDGQAVAFIRNAADSTTLMIQRFPGGQEEYAMPIADRSVWLTKPNPIRSNSRTAWSADGRFVLLSDSDDLVGTASIFAYDLLRHRRFRLTDAPAGQRDTAPVVSEDGRSLAFARFVSNSSANIFLAPLHMTADSAALTAGTPSMLTKENVDVRGLSWLGPRRLLFSSNRSGAYGLWTYDLDSGLEKPFVAYGDNTIDPSASRDGSRVVYTDAQGTTNLVRLRLNSSPGSGGITPEPLFSSSRNSNSAAFSPDGRKIAFFSDRSGSWNLWIGSADGTQLNQITRFDKSMAGSARWSPDGRQVAFDARPNGHSQVFVIFADGGSPALADAGGTEEKQPSWSADGQSLYVNSNRSGTAQLWKVPVRRPGAATMLCACTGYNSQEARGRLYFTNSGPGIFSVPVGGGVAEPVAGLENRWVGRLWQVTAEGILFIPHQTHLQDRSKEVTELSLLAWGKKTPQVLAHLNFWPGHETPSLSGHGPEILLTREERRQSDLMLMSQVPATD